MYTTFNDIKQIYCYYNYLSLYQILILSISLVYSLFHTYCVIILPARRVYIYYPLVFMLEQLPYMILIIQLVKHSSDG